ncbi:ribonuclease domain-containing protein [Dermacoccaceae bacterium W4C1]
MNPAMLRRGWPALVLGVMVLILLIALGVRGGSSGSGSSDPTTPAMTDSAGSGASGSQGSSGSSGSHGARADDGLSTVATADLPRQARQTIALIKAGGPFPYRQDDQTFSNREGVLPEQPRGYYREYTVITPGEDDRGARRIVTGKDGTMYYTDDHYDSFRRIE